MNLITLAMYTQGDWKKTPSQEKIKIKLKNDNKYKCHRVSNEELLAGKMIK